MMYLLLLRGSVASIKASIYKMTEFWTIIFILTLGRKSLDGVICLVEGKDVWGLLWIEKDDVAEQI